MLLVILKKKKKTIRLCLVVVRAFSDPSAKSRKINTRFNCETIFLRRVKRVMSR